MTDSFDQISMKMIEKVEVEMRRILRADQDPVEPFLGMIHYHMGWRDEDLLPETASSGKRVRPLLCLLSCQAAGGDWKHAVPGAAALEILHNFTLVHDDIQDESPTRRGRPTLWNVWGQKQAINAGDAMFALAHLAMGRLASNGIETQQVYRAIMRMNEICLDLTLGQFLDMGFEERASVSVNEYIEMIDGKTAALISFSCELGALVAGVDALTVDHYAEFGRDLGLAFQVRDDILGIWGDESLIGKSAATDISTRKKSLPVLFGLERNSELRLLYAQESVDSGFVARAVQLLDEEGAREYAEGYEERYASSALHHLEAADPAGPASEALYHLSLRLLNREK